MDSKQCRAEGCERPTQARGLCSMHYQRVRAAERPRCKIEGCDRPAGSGRGWCHRHYKRWQMHGDPLVNKAVKRIDRPCEVSGCNQPFIARDLCPTHYKRWQLHGDPYVTKKVGAKRTRTRWVDANGYVNFYRPDHPNALAKGHVKEHVVVMSEILGRPMRKGETIHHKNGIRHDNRPENLELWTRSHCPGQRVSDLLAFAHSIIEEYKDDPQLWPEGIEPP